MALLTARDTKNWLESKSWLILLGTALLMVVSSNQSPVRASETTIIYLDGPSGSLPPVGWVQFCQDMPSGCGSIPSDSHMINYGTPAWLQLRAINQTVNQTIAPITDLDHWGMVERWSLPVDGQGDCEDYVLEKRRRLIEAGVPSNALMVGVVLDKDKLGHAILIARTSRGDLVLDNQENRILEWRQTGYTFIKRQDPRDPRRWVSLKNINSVAGEPSISAAIALPKS